MANSETQAPAASQASDAVHADETTSAPAEADAAPVATAAPPAEHRRWRPSRSVLGGVAGVAVAFLLFGSGFAAGSHVEGGHDDHRPRLMRQAPGGASPQDRPMRRDGRMPGQQQQRTPSP